MINPKYPTFDNTTLDIYNNSIEMSFELTLNSYRSSSDEHNQVIRLATTTLELHVTLF
jgi:hypothetical protein